MIFKWHKCKAQGKTGEKNTPKPCLKNKENAYFSILWHQNTLKYKLHYLMLIFTFWKLKETNNIKVSLYNPAFEVAFYKLLLGFKIFNMCTLTTLSSVS